MVRRFRRRIKVKWTKKYVYLLIVLIIVIFTGIIFVNYVLKVNVKAMRIIRLKLHSINTYIINNTVNNNIMTDENINNLIVINKNKQGEIETVDFNMEVSYTLIKTITKEIQNKILVIEKGNLEEIGYRDKDVLNNMPGIVITLPYGLHYDNVFLANLGPKIPIKTNFTGSVFAGLKTQVTNYGINNALIQIYIELNLTEQVYFPTKPEKINFNYSVLIASKIIPGKIPTYYGGAINTNSSILSQPIIK